MGGHRYIAVVVFALSLGVTPAALIAQVDGTGASAGASEGSGEPLGTGAEAVTGRITLPEGSFFVGDPVALRLDLALPDGVHFDAARLVDAGFIEADEATVADASGGAVVTIEVTAYRPGRHRVGGIVVSVLGRDGILHDVRLDGFEVPIAALAGAEVDPQLRAEEAGVAVRYEDYTLAWILGIAAALLLMGLAGYVIARSRPKIVVEAPPPPPRPAHEVAFEKLDALRASGLVEQGEVMAFYVRLSEAVREYVGRRYGFQGLDMTTEEILEAMGEARLPAVLGDNFLPHLLYQCDLVKFAKAAPGSDEPTEALEDGYRLVRTTTASAALQGPPAPQANGVADGEQPVAAGVGAPESNGHEAEGAADEQPDVDDVEADHGSDDEELPALDFAEVVPPTKREGEGGSTP